MIARYVLAAMAAAGIWTASVIDPAWAMETRAGAHDYQIYLLKGLGDIFSAGIDTLAAKLKARGVTAEVDSHAAYESLARSTIANWRGGRRGPIILAGHSLGADAAVLMAERLNAARIPVALLVTFGPVNDTPVPANVARAINYFQSNSAWHGRTSKGPGFHGVLQNVDLAQAPGITHFNIEKSDRLQAETMANVFQVLSMRTRSAPTGKSRAATANTALVITGTAEQSPQH